MTRPEAGSSARAPHCAVCVVGTQERSRVTLHRTIRQDLSMSRQRIASNMVILATGQVATWASTLVYVILVGRYLLPDGYGELVLARAIISVAWLAATLGMHTYITRA